MKGHNSIEETSQLNLIDSDLELMPNYEDLPTQAADLDPESTATEATTLIPSDIADIENIAPDELAAELVGDEFDDDSDDLLDEDEEDEEDNEDSAELGDITAVLDSAHVKIDPNLTIAILPLVEADLPDTCYIVIDKASEIVARPLQDFRDLGKIPPHEQQALTVPVFDNHRIARRFSSHNQRVVKFPSDLIYSTHSRLAQKGITRMLFDGQVFAL
jgi:hypothetical protein